MLVDHASRRKGAVVNISLSNLLYPDMSLLADAEYVICLDSVGGSDSLHLHLSKPPKEGTLPYEILQVSLQPSFKSVFSKLHSLAIDSLSLLDSTLGECEILSRDVHEVVSFIC